MGNSGWYFRYSPYVLAECDADRLELRPNRVVRAITLLLIVSGLAVLGGAGRILSFDPAEVQEARWIFGGGLVCLGVALGCQRRIVLDKRNGVISVTRGPFRTTQFPLTAVSAVRVTHVPYSRSFPGRMSRPAGDRVDLMPTENSAFEPIRLTYHSQSQITREMAVRIAEFLGVDIEGQLPAKALEPSSVGWGVRFRRVVAKLCLWGAAAGILGLIALSLEQRSRDELEKTLRPVEARLLELEVTEWIEGRDSWYLRGVFEVTLDGQTLQADGDLIPQSVYREMFGSRVNRVVPRHVPASLAESWIIGKTYHGFVHTDQPTHIFFEPPPSGEVTRRWRWCLLGISAVLLVLWRVLMP
jgi:hypothetical protein